ncbi:hypothetical protein JG687_00014059 [Phytophthora cactorum]|uniref:Uncharacterized protein n=1 Tax=Phytophthora cactorum TaxID=29920 RepID=A0A8T1TZR1_9STRA|nr:hypothetical protein PC120_g9765 [Phytophthora cactorum]KAG3071025.1 hypothetical protein PC121_g9349 [Phytophthora cactorum]KAG3152862.1 hypothetical protein PC128_g22691 [Phytophthora cactorum]KAG4058334.1 hypothetical protein PC123_g6679 [Phytophthora cactorum]KAG6950752.1 hypothetical protein JG687_00014059 [Phytophthora cactorum]
MSGAPDSGRVTVKQSPGRSISLCIGMRFATRQDESLHIKDFALVQGKQALLNLKPTRGTANVYVCSSKTKCSFKVRVLGSKSTLASDCFVSSFGAEHNGCSGFAKATAVQIASMSNIKLKARVLAAACYLNMLAQNKLNPFFAELISPMLLLLILTCFAISHVCLIEVVKL